MCKDDDQIVTGKTYSTNNMKHSIIVIYIYPKTIKHYENNNLVRTLMFMYPLPSLPDEVIDKLQSPYI